MSKTIIKAKISSGGLEVSYTDRNVDEDFTDECTLKRGQMIHKDLREAFDKLKAHVICIGEFNEQGKITVENLESIGEELSNLVITGFSTGGSDESEGACITAQRIIASGKVLNITTPFMQFDNEDYEFASEFSLSIEGCIYEVKQYIEEFKFGVRQTSLDFDGPTAEDIAIAENTGDNVNEVAERRTKRRKTQKQGDSIPAA